MKVLLVAPPWLHIYGDFREAAKIGCVSPPLGLMYLGGAVRSAGAECRIVDMQSEQVDLPGLLEIIEQEQPDLVGITATTPVYENARILVDRIRERFADPWIALGGVHATIMGRTVIEECPQLDLQVCGEAEGTIAEIIEALRGERPLENINGVLVRREGQIIENPPRPLRENLDTIPFPARNLMDPDLFRHYLPDRGYVCYAGLFTARGCPFECTFCSQHTMYGRRVRWHGVDRVIDELKYITGEMGIDHVIVMDETLTLNKPRLLKICRRIEEEGLQFTWEGWTHAATIDEELLVAMKRSGLIRLSFGIESGDPEILYSIRKSVTLEQIRTAFQLAERVGIETRGSAMLGHPGETKRSAWRTIRFLRGLRECQQVFLNVACPYPGTELYRKAVSGEGGMKLLTNDYSEYTRYGNPVIAVNDLSAKDLKRLQSLGLLYFYLTPRRIWYNLVKRVGLKSGMVNALAFVKGTVRSLLHTRA